MQDDQTYIIAEVGVNHNGSCDMAKKLVEIAAEAGADAVKFQTYKTEALVSKTAEKAEYQTKTTDPAESQFAMLKKLELSEANFRLLAKHCQDVGIDFLSTPFDIGSLNFLCDQLQVPVLKVPSGEINNAPLLLAAARSGRKLIVSTGMCVLGDIEEALSILAFGFLHPQKQPSRLAFRQAYSTAEGQQALNERVILLHCTTAYPTPYSQVNLRVMDTLAAAFPTRIGYSDHTRGITVPVAAVARGAVVIEKHFTLDRTLPGPDHQASLEPSELRKMVTAIREAEQALGGKIKSPTQIEQHNSKVARKSLVALTNISKGETFSLKNLGVKRPGDGISPMLFWDFLGQTASRDYQEDEVIR